MLSGDGAEAERCLRDLEVPHFHHEFVYEVKPASPLGPRLHTDWPHWEKFRWDCFIRTVFNLKTSACENLLFVQFLLSGSDQVEHIKMTLYLSKNLCGWFFFSPSGHRDGVGIQRRQDVPNDSAASHVSLGLLRHYGGPDWEGTLPSCVWSHVSLRTLFQLVL